MNNQFPNKPITNFEVTTNNPISNNQMPTETFAHQQPQQPSFQAPSQNQNQGQIIMIDWNALLKNPDLEVAQVQWVQQMIQQLDFVIINKDVLKNFNKEQQQALLPFTIYDQLINIIFPDEVALAAAQKEELIVSLKILIFFLAKQHQEQINFNNSNQQPNEHKGVVVINDNYIRDLINFVKTNDDLTKLNGFFTNNLQDWNNTIANQTISVITTLIYNHFLNPQLKAIIQANQKLINKIPLIDLKALFILNQKAISYNLSAELLNYLVSFLPTKQTGQNQPQFTSFQATTNQSTPLQYESENITLSQE